MALLVLLGLLACWPVLVHGAPDLSHDGIFHAIWAKQFAVQFWQGDWYPRWFTNINAGFGGPSGFFYPPLASYASSLFWPFMGARDPDAWRATGYALVLAEVLSGITAYLWLRSLTKSRAALLGAIVYMIAPYHLGIDLYQRGAAAEFWVFVWLPLILLSAEGLLRHSKWAVLGVAASFGLAVLSHPTVALCFTPIAVAYVFLLSASKERVRATALFLVALLLGVGLDAIYLLPAMLDQNKSYASLQTAAWADYHSNWLWQDGDDIRMIGRYLYDMVRGNGIQVPPYVPYRARILTVSLLALAAIVPLFLVIRKWEHAARTRRIALFYLGTAFVYFFLMTNWSDFIWKTALFLKYLQFPYRLNIILVVCVAVLAALAGAHLVQPYARITALALALIAAGWIGVDVLASTQEFSALRPASERVQEHRQWMRTQMEFPNLWPRPAKVDVLQGFAAFDLFVIEHPPRTVRLAALSTGRAVGTARVESWRPRLLVLNIAAPQDSQLTLNHFYYAGWQGRIDRAASILPVWPSPDGLIRLDVPKGNYDLILELPKDRPERAGAMISLLSFLLLCATAICAVCKPTSFRHGSGA